MSVLSRQFESYLGSSSWIRRMFESGMKLKQQYGADAVCDFSIGNPDLPPPHEVAEALRDLADVAGKPFSFGYMPNGGYPWALDMLAEQLSKEQGIKLQACDVMMSCGAAGALNALFRAVLDRGDEVLCISPYFVEYGFYAENHGGVLKTVPARLGDFGLDLAAIDAALNEKTRVIIINSPNNPTGAIYPRKDLEDLAGILRAHNMKSSRPVFIAADEPYRFLAFDGAEVPSMLPLYEYTAVVGSFSKNLSLPGERIGFVALAPQMPDKATLMGGLYMANRILGFVNPPVAGQHILKKALGKQVDLKVYAERRKAMAEVLKDASYDFVMPRGAFYFFPKAPGGDDVAFCDLLSKELILGVPGRGFGLPGYFRLSFCVDEAVIRRASEGFKKAKAAAAK